MKRKYLAILAVVLSGALMSSCEEETEGALYAGDAGKVSFLAPTFYPDMTDNDGSKILVPMGRTDKGGELNVGVTLTSTLPNYTTVFTVPGGAKFNAGEGGTNVEVNYGNLALVNPGALAINLDNASATGKDIVVKLAFPFTLSIADADLVSPSKVSSVSVNASKLLTFGAPMTASLNSLDGWWGETYDVQVEKANGANVYKIKSPFGYRDLAFLVSSDGKTVNFPNQICYKHGTYGDVSMTGVTGTISGKVVTLKVTAYTVSAGSFGGGIEILTLP